MSEVTLLSLAVDRPDLAPVAEAAARQGLQVGRLLGAGGYGAVFAATAADRGECVLKVAGVEFAGSPEVRHGENGPYRAALPGSLYGVHLFSLTGPFITTAPATLAEAGALLEAACRRQERAAGCPLARLHAVLRLGGRPAALYERLRGRSLRSLLAEDPGQARAAVPAVARALALLHDTFGGHGDLKPDHIFVDPGRVAFIDPLPERCWWLGSLGYTLPFVPWAADDGWLRDLGSLAAILAELWGGSVGWDEGLVSCVANGGNGRFGGGFDPAAVLDQMRAGTAGLPPDVRSWVLDVGRRVVDAVRLAPPAPGWCRRQLDALAVTAAPARPKRWWSFWK